MNFKKKVNGSWTDIPHYIHNTSTDTITTLPADIFPNAATATVGLKGNMSQTGTPTHDNPIMPEGCGDLETVGAKAGQYKIPISSASTTTPVYLGEVETTRKIKKLVLTGDETSWISVSGNAPYRIILPDIVSTSDRNSVLFLSTHYLAVTNNDPWSQYNTCVSWGFSGNTNVKCLQFRDINQATLADFKTYLQQQYAAGTPVTVWYVLAEPETGIVNEPLRKIGDYADTVSGITIPTIAGANTISVDTTLQPSEVTVNYKGWHPAIVHERTNGAWT